MNVKYEIPIQTSTMSTGSKIYTKAVYVIRHNNEKLTYTSTLISMIDVPYKRYRLI